MFAIAESPKRKDLIWAGSDDGLVHVMRDGGKTWSSILNQATGEFYMVAVNDQFPYRLYGPQQDNSTVVVPSLPPVSWGLDSPLQIWGQVSGCETGQVWPRPDGSVVWGACKGEVGRYVVATGQEQHYWVYPQNRYGHNPADIRYRFPRQSGIVVSPHDPKVIDHPSHVVHRARPRPRRCRATRGRCRVRRFPGRRSGSASVDRGSRLRSPPPPASAWQQLAEGVEHSSARRS